MLHIVCSSWRWRQASRSRLGWADSCPAGLTQSSFKAGRSSSEGCFGTRLGATGPGRKRALTSTPLNNIFETFHPFFPIPIVVWGSILMRSSHLHDPLRSVCFLKRIPRNPSHVAPTRVSFTELTGSLVAAPSSGTQRGHFASDSLNPSLTLKESSHTRQSDSDCPCSAANVFQANSRWTGTNSHHDDRRHVDRLSFIAAAASARTAGGVGAGGAVFNVRDAV